MIEVTNAGVGTLVCCEKPMVRLDATRLMLLLRNMCL